MGWFGKSKEEKMLEKVLERLNEVERKIDRPLDSTPLVRSVQASFNGIKAANDNFANRMVNLVSTEFEKRLGRTVNSAIRDEENIKKMEDRKNREVKVIDEDKDEDEKKDGDEDEQ